MRILYRKIYFCSQRNSSPPVKRRQRTHAASGGASEALPHEVGARPSRSEPKLNTHALYPSRSELRGITFKNKSFDNRSTLALQPHSKSRFLSLMPLHSSITLFRFMVKLSSAKLITFILYLSCTNSISSKTLFALLVRNLRP